MVGLGVHWLGRQPAITARVMHGTVLFSVAVVAAVHVVMIVRFLGFITQNYNDSYGLPLSASEAVAADVVTYAAGCHARRHRGIPEA